MQLLEKENLQHTYFNTDVAELDITNEEAINRFVEENEIDGIVNCAAYTAVDKAEENQELCMKLNATAPEYLAKAIEKRGGWMIQISTDYVFDGTNHRPYVETDSVCPNSTYGRTKLAGEEAVLASCKKSMIIRTAWLYSTFGNNFVKTMIRLGNEKPELGVIFDQIGTPTYARDLAVAIFAAINKGVVPGVYHFSNEGVISWYDFTKAIHRIAGIKDCKVRPLHTAEYPTPAARPHYSVLDKTKIKQTYGIEIPYWESSLTECISSLLGTD
jgi:dTDP-4-dehydrorhamnose reductase